MARIALDGLKKRFVPVEAVRDVTLNIHDREFFCLLGPSGCGKTTVLRMIAGFERPSQGAILLDDVNITTVPPHLRNIGMVFQNYALFPLMTVEQNVSFGLKMHRVPPAEAARRVESVLELLGLAGHRDRFPRHLSGGEQQRVAVGRVLVLRPKALLFDEPLSNLDAKLRKEMRYEIRRLQREVGTTAVYVTHDQEEAMAVADRIAVMRSGRLEQVGTPSEVYDRPRTRFVADFVGTSNLLEATVSSADRDCVICTAVNSGLKVEIGVTIDSTPPQVGSTGTIGIRPEKLRLHSATNDRAGVKGRVLSVAKFGATIEIRVVLEGGHPLVVHAREEELPFRPTEPGQEVSISWVPGAWLYFRS